MGSVGGAGGRSSVSLAAEPIASGGWEFGCRAGAKLSRNVEAAVAMVRATWIRLRCGSSAKRPGAVLSPCVCVLL